MISADELARCKAAIPAMKHRLGLHDWHIEVLWGKTEADVRGVCTATPRYRTATIRIDETEHDDGESVLRTLRHEMLHIATSEFEPMYDGAIALARSDGERELIQCLHQECGDRLVLMLERMLEHGLGVTLEALAEEVA